MTLGTEEAVCLPAGGLPGGEAQVSVPLEQDPMAEATADGAVAASEASVIAVVGSSAAAAPSASPSAPSGWRGGSAATQSVTPEAVELEAQRPFLAKLRPKIEVPRLRFKDGTWVEQGETDVLFLREAQLEHGPLEWGAPLLPR